MRLKLVPPTLTVLSVPPCRLQRDFLNYPKKITQIDFHNV
nr:MAG TPA: hypothetical protein [Caudoviricetes sp.]